MQHINTEHKYLRNTNISYTVFTELGAIHVYSFQVKINNHFLEFRETLNLFNFPCIRVFSNPLIQRTLFVLSLSADLSTSIIVIDTKLLTFMHSVWISFH
jgi:hypothetical protein